MQVELPLFRIAHLSAEGASTFWVWETKAGKPRIARSLLGHTDRMLLLLADALERGGGWRGVLGDWPGVLAA
jgi:hypothetical protein